MRAYAWTATTDLAWRESFEVRETPPEWVLRRPKVYLDTTIPSYLAARVSPDLTVSRYQKVTHRWWNSWRASFDIRISEYVWWEAAVGNPEAAERRLQLLRPFPTLEINERSIALRHRLLRDSALPAGSSVDAAHVATAAIQGMEFLLTWNFAHLVNPHLSSKIRTSCESEGYSCPLLCTPEQLMERYEHAHA